MFEIIAPYVKNVNGFKLTFINYLNFSKVNITFTFDTIYFISVMFPDIIPSINCFAARAERVPRFSANFSAAASSF